MLNAKEAYLIRQALLCNACHQLQLPGDRAKLHLLAAPHDGLSRCKTAMLPVGHRDTPCGGQADISSGRQGRTVPKGGYTKNVVLAPPPPFALLSSPCFLQTMRGNW